MMYTIINNKFIFIFTGIEELISCKSFDSQISRGDKVLSNPERDYTWLILIKDGKVVTYGRVRTGTPPFVYVPQLEDVIKFEAPLENKSSE